MYLLLIGISGLLLKYLEIAPVAQLSWWWLMSPFALAVVWWYLADSSGYTKRKEVKKMEDRKRHRIEKHRAVMGELPGKRH